MGERIVLVGMMGAGKTTVGRWLADHLGWAYLDSDAEIERETGRTVPEIFARDGEAAFRRQETRVLAEALARPDPVVVSAAGGVVLAEENRRALAASGGPVVWLRAEPATLAGRVGTGEGRPLLDEDPAATLARLDAVRRPRYAEVADLAVDVDHLGPAEIGRRILESLALSDRVAR
jgi:shikimate kinase